MATKINGNALTEKGIVKTKVRELVVGNETQDIVACGYEKVDNKSVYVKEYTDGTGHTFYATIELKVSATHPSQLTPKKSSKKKATNTETFEIVEG